MAYFFHCTRHIARKRASYMPFPAGGLDEADEAIFRA
jgi:hypothetical protein